MQKTSGKIGKRKGKEKKIEKKNKEETQRYFFHRRMKE